MSNLMEELMAEINRVNSLETEVATTVKNTMREVNLARSEKLQNIFSFIEEMRDVLMKAGMLKFSDSYFFVQTNIENRNSMCRWRYNIKIYADTNSFVVNYHNGWNSDQRVFRDMKNNYEHACFVIDHWDDETYAVIRNGVAKRIQQELSCRIEEATKKLRNANAKHAIYYEDCEK